MILPAVITRSCHAGPRGCPRRTSHCLGGSDHARPCLRARDPWPRGGPPRARADWSKYPGRRFSDSRPVFEPATRDCPDGCTTSLRDHGGRHSSTHCIEGPRRPREGRRALGTGVAMNAPQVRGIAGLWDRTLSPSRLAGTNRPRVSEPKNSRPTRESPSPSAPPLPVAVRRGRRTGRREVSEFGPLTACLTSHGFLKQTCGLAHETLAKSCGRAGGATALPRRSFATSLMQSCATSLMQSYGTLPTAQSHITWNPAVSARGCSFSSAWMGANVRRILW